MLCPGTMDRTSLPASQPACQLPLSATRILSHIPMSPSRLRASYQGQSERVLQTGGHSTTPATAVSLKLPSLFWSWVIRPHYWIDDWECHHSWARLVVS